MSKVKNVNIKKWDIKAYPTFRLYTAPKTFKEYTEKELNEDKIRAWLVDQKTEGITKVIDPKKQVSAYGPEAPPQAPINDKER
tara:strand:+ start:399 stop:647 length:249 start_codon:yes stop_codon:yes gene_type:complete